MSQRTSRPSAACRQTVLIVAVGTADTCHIRLHVDVEDPEAVTCIGAAIDPDRRQCSDMCECRSAGLHDVHNLPRCRLRWRQGNLFSVTATVHL